MRSFPAGPSIIAIALLAPACRPTPSVDATPGSAANTGSLDGVAAVYAEDAPLLPPNEPAVKGREAIRQHWGRFLDAYTLTFELVTDDLDGRDDLAYVRGPYTLTASPRAQGGAAMSDQGKFVDVLRRQVDGSWRYVIDMYNSDLAAGK